MKIASENHWGGDGPLRRMIFTPDAPDPLRRRAGSRAGAMSILTGVAAVRSVERDGAQVAISDLF